MSAITEASVWEEKAFTGKWTRLAGGTAEVFEPATGERLTVVGKASAADVTESARAAHEAQAAWVAAPWETRAATFRKAARCVEENRARMIGWIVRETGSVTAKAAVEVQAAAGILHQAAAMPGEPQGLVLPSNGGRISLARRVPHGVVGVISPFNFPLILSLRAVAPALATGNAVVLKPDPRTAVSGGFLIARIFEEAGLPAGLLHVLPGGAEAGEALCRDTHIGMISFTGSTAAGRKVGALAGEHLKKVSLELGGKNSLIVLDDADLDAAASNARWGAWLHQGQICMAAGRLLVQQSIAEEFVDRLVKAAERLVVGDPSAGRVGLGPLIDERQRDRVHGIVEESVAAGARLRAGGRYENLFYRPTVLDGVQPGMRAFEEEIFGPVAAVTTFASDDEAVELANRTEYGLAAGVISKSIARALSVGNRLRCGLLHINDQTVMDEAVAPFGGRGNSGNGTRIGGPANWDEFTAWQWVTIQDKPTTYPL
jgi:benzaldehyde dehydrogenase (NAD)